MSFFNFFNKKRAENKDQNIIIETPQTFEQEKTEPRTVMFPHPGLSAGAKKVFFEADDPSLKFLFEYRSVMDENYMDHSDRIYFHTQTKKFVYRRIISTSPGFHSGNGWGVGDQYEVSYEYVQEILELKFSDDDESFSQYYKERKEKIFSEIQKCINDQA